MKKLKPSDIWDKPSRAWLDAVQGETNKIIAICNDCHAEFTKWISDSNKCPECEGSMLFFDCLQDILQEDWEEKFDKEFADDSKKLTTGQFLFQFKKYVNYYLVKDFIRLLLAQKVAKARQDEREKTLKSLIK